MGLQEGKETYYEKQILSYNENSLREIGEKLEKRPTFFFCTCITLRFMLHNPFNDLSISAIFQEFINQWIESQSKDLKVLHFV